MSQVSQWEPRVMLRTAVICGVYSLVGKKQRLSEGDFLALVMGKFVRVNSRCIESRNHLEVVGVAYSAYQLHHDNPALSKQHDLVKALFDCNLNNVIGLLKATSTPH